MREKTICPDCGGNGFNTAMVDGERMRGMAHITCSRCKGAGEISPEDELWLRIGTTHRTWRVAQHEGLAACAERLCIDDRDLNDMEHGRRDASPLLTDIPQVLRDIENLPLPRAA